MTVSHEPATSAVQIERPQLSYIHGITHMRGWNGDAQRKSLKLNENYAFGPPIHKSLLAYVRVEFAKDCEQDQEVFVALNGIFLVRGGGFVGHQL